MLKKNFLKIVASVAACASVFLVTAQRVPVTPVTSVLQQNQQEIAPQEIEAVLLADVGLVDVISVEKSGTYNGQYFLQGKMGQQNGISVGVVVYDEKNTVVDVKSLVRGVIVREGEMKQLSFSYTIPSYVHGKVRVMLKAETEGGLPLATNLITEKIEKISPPKADILSCSGGASGLSCIASENGDVMFNVSPTSFFTPSTVIEVKGAEKGKSFTFTKVLPPGRYFAQVTFTKTGEQKFVQFTVAGAYGKFLSAIVNSTQPGMLNVTASARIASLEKANVNAVLIGKDGAECGKTTQEITSAVPLLTFSVQSSCKEGVMTLKLMDKATILDSRTETFSVIPYVDQKQLQVTPVTTKGIKGITLMYWVMAIVALVIMSGIFFIARRYMRKAEKAD